MVELSEHEFAIRQQSISNGFPRSTVIVSFLPAKITFSKAEKQQYKVEQSTIWHIT